MLLDLKAKTVKVSSPEARLIGSAIFVTNIAVNSDTADRQEVDDRVKRVAGGQAWVLNLAMGNPSAAASSNHEQGVSAHLA